MAERKSLRPERSAGRRRRDHDRADRVISLKLTPSEIEARLARAQRKEKPALGFMARYRKLVSSAPRGAVLE